MLFNSPADPIIHHDRNRNRNFKSTTIKMTTSDRPIIFPAVRFPCIKRTMPTIIPTMGNRIQTMTSTQVRNAGPERHCLSEPVSKSYPQSHVIVPAGLSNPQIGHFASCSSPCCFSVGELPPVISTCTPATQESEWRQLGHRLSLVGRTRVPQ